MTTTDATCGNNNGTITLGAVTGGIAPYTYSFNGTAFTATQFTITWLQEPILSRSRMPTDVSSMHRMQQLITGGPTAIAVTTTDASCGNSNGTITLGAVTGGTAPYTYSFNGSAFTATTVYNNLAAGTYTIAVKDANGCVFNAPDATVTNTGGALAITVTIADASCGNSNGTITLGAVTGGVAPYTYSVNGLHSLQRQFTITWQQATYTIAVKDANGCVFNAPIVTIANTGGINAIAVTTTDASCANSTGTITGRSNGWHSAIHLFIQWKCIYCNDSLQ